MIRYNDPANSKIRYLITKEIHENKVQASLVTKIFSKYYENLFSNMSLCPLRPV